MCCKILLRVQILLYDIRATYVLHKIYQRQELMSRDRDQNGSFEFDQDQKNLMNQEKNYGQYNKIVPIKRNALNHNLVLEELEIGLQQL